MLTDKDFEKLWFMYQTEGLPANLSIQAFCSMKNVPYNAYEKWERTRNKKIVPVEVEGMPSADLAAGVSAEIGPANAPMPGSRQGYGKRTGRYVFVRLTFPGGISMAKRCYVDHDNSKCLYNDKGARGMWLLHSFRATCQLLKKSFQRYLQTVLDWIIVDGRTDYHNMTPDLVEC